MRYPDYYVDDVKENCIDENVEYEIPNKLRISDTNPSYRRSFEENAGALKENNHRYSEDSNNDKRTSKSSQRQRDYRNSKASSTGSDKNESRRVTTHSTKSESRHSKSTHSSSSGGPCDRTIALFGVNGVTGHYFLQLAVEAGYHVRAMIIPGFELEDMKDNPNLTLIHGTMDDVRKIHRVIRKAAYVVCMLTDCPQPLEGSPHTLSNYNFIQNLVPLMSECDACKVLLYQVRRVDSLFGFLLLLFADQDVAMHSQATSFAADGKGATPMFTNVVKKMAIRKNRRETLQEQDKIIRYINKFLKARELEGDESPFQYIITRPSEMIWDRPSRKKLEASKSVSLATSSGM